MSGFSTIERVSKNRRPNVISCASPQTRRAVGSVSFTNAAASVNWAVTHSEFAKLRADISADNYFGARHGIETLFQLMEYDDITMNYIILNSAEIRDYPEFRHRGISLDTSRNFIEVDTIKRIIDGMGHSKVREP